MKTNHERKKDLQVNADGGLGLIGFLFTVGIFIGIAFSVLSIYPVLNEKIKVDMALESLISNPEASTMSIQNIASTIEKQLNMNYVTSLKKKDILKALSVKNTKDGRTLFFKYEITNQALERWKLVYEYEKDVLIPRSIN
ncbi:MAG: DUF4845 domain-containing protein [Pseudomonadota bacterium]|nr:DUF4845 domain-containing protein [Pseudomonadota bacterium]